MSKTTKTRMLVCFILAAILIPSLFIANGNAFRIILIAATFIAGFEFFSIVSLRCISFAHSVISGATIAAMMLFLMSEPINLIVLVLACVVINDVFAYIFGRVYGGHIFEDARPFPKTSPNKTWEGIIGGIISEIFLGTLVSIALYGVEPPNEAIVTVCIGGFVAVIGDYYESHLKRQAEIKDSNDFVKDVPVIGQIEMLLGGRDGHGGYYDRLDSAIMLGTIMITYDIVRTIIPT